MDLGNSFYLIALLGMSQLFLDEPEATVPSAEASARPSSVRLPYALVPGMDITSRAYQKAAALLGQIVQETANARPILPGNPMSSTAFGKFISLLLLTLSDFSLFFRHVARHFF